MNRNIFLLAVAVGWSCMGIGPAMGQDWAARVDAIGEGERTGQKVPGLVLVVVKGQSIAYAKGFGVASVETKEAVTADHLFRVGSTTKMVTGAAVAAAEAISLKAGISAYLPELEGSPLGRLTAEQLLSHTAGLMDRTLMYGRHDDEALRDNVRGLQPDVLFTAPGQVYSYSNLGYAMAGRVLEAATRRPFADAVAELIFRPLGMKRTTFRPTLAMTYPLAQGHIREKGEWVIARPAADHSGYWPAGSMFTSGNDFARFAMALLHEGRASELDRVPASVIQAITTPRVETGGGGHYGLGLAVHHVGSRLVWSHGGARQGYSTHLMAAPGEKIAVLALLNVSGGNAARPAAKVFEAVAGWNPEVAPVTRPVSLRADQVSGVYSQYTTTMVVREANGKLMLDRDELLPDKGDCFRRKAGKVCFVMGGETRARYLLLGSRAFARRD
jgi:CubicO group peptidase (beta-lactamase class C family)